MRIVKFFIIIITPLIIIYSYREISFTYHWKKESKIREVCHPKAYRENELNFEYADGKNWSYLTSPNGTYGWVYPVYEVERNTIYDTTELSTNVKYDDEEVIINEILEKVKHRREEVYASCLRSKGLNARPRF